MGSEKRGPDMTSLPNFPTPYPGESLYSILCRYHVRSCNKSDSQTITQLFGKPTSLMYTLLSPVILTKETGWLKSLAGISLHRILLDHTALRIILPFVRPDDYRILSDAASNLVVHRTLFRRIQNKLIHSSKYLRFCPKCAAEQQSLFGEPYWQVLPQVEGYEVCHLHGVPIRESEIPLKEIRYRFVPAAYALRNGARENLDVLNKRDSNQPSYKNHADQINQCYLYGDKMLPYRRLLFNSIRSQEGKIDCRIFTNDSLVEFPKNIEELLRDMFAQYKFSIGNGCGLSHIQLIRMYELLEGTIPP